VSRPAGLAAAHMDCKPDPNLGPCSIDHHTNLNQRTRLVPVQVGPCAACHWGPGPLPGTHKQVQATTRLMCRGRHGRVHRVWTWLVADGMDDVQDNQVQRFNIDCVPGSAVRFRRKSPGSELAPAFADVRALAGRQASGSKSPGSELAPAFADVGHWPPLTSLPGHVSTCSALHRCPWRRLPTPMATLVLRLMKALALMPMLMLGLTLLPMLMLTSVLTLAPCH